MDILYLSVTIIMSAAIGMLMGIIGGGGGGVYVVLLLLVFKQDAKTAAVTALILSTVTLSGAAWQYWRKKQFRKDYMILLTITDVVGTLLGNHMLNLVSEKVIKIVMFCVLAISGISSLFKLKYAKNEVSEVKDALKNVPITGSIGLVSGLATGTTGLSASTMISSLLIGVLNFSPYMAVGTTTLVSFAGNFASILLLFITKTVFSGTEININFCTLLIFGAGSAMGAFFGARLSSKVNRKVLIIVLSVLAIVPGIYILISN